MNFLTSVRWIRNPNAKMCHSYPPCVSLNDSYFSCGGMLAKSLRSCWSRETNSFSKVASVGKLICQGYYYTNNSNNGISTDVVTASHSHLWSMRHCFQPNYNTGMQMKDAWKLSGIGWHGRIFVWRHWKCNLFSLLVAVLMWCTSRRDLKDFNGVPFRCFQKTNVQYSTGESTRMLLFIFNSWSLSVAITLLIAVACS